MVQEILIPKSKETPDFVQKVAEIDKTKKSKVWEIFDFQNSRVVSIVSSEFTAAYANTKYLTFFLPSRSDDITYIWPRDCMEKFMK